jgi:DNA primase
VESQRPGSDYKSQVLAAIDIVELIGRSVSLKKRGRNYLGLCPFHQEKTPSFNVNQERQFFRCFGCGAKGNAIDFVMQRDRIEFLDALRQLGQQLGIEMPRYGQTKEKASQRQLLLDANSAAGTFFEKLLSQAADPSAVAARAYLEKRGFTTESVRSFHIGIAPNSWDALLTSSVARKFPPSLLAAAGLVKPRENGGGFYDTFRNRLMFPIRDENGRVIAFGGRVMPGSDDKAKYLNSPETPIFSKSRCMFGLDLARQKIVETRSVAVVEGYTDVVMAHQFGVSNVVSPLGTALTEQHVSMLRRFADRIVLLFDADDAGDAAVDRAVELFLTQPIEIAIASMPHGTDPDEYLLQHGADGFEAMLRNASDALTYKWKQLVRRFNEHGDDLTGQQKAVQQYMDVLAAARGSGPVDALRWGSALARVSRLTDIPMAELNRRFREKKPPVNRAPARLPQAHADVAVEPTNGVPDAPSVAPKRSGPLTAQDRAERWILAILLAEPQRWFDVQQHVHVQEFTEETRRRLAEVYWQHQRDEGEPVFSAFLGMLDDPATSELAVDLVEEFETLSDIERSLTDALALIRQSGERAERDKLLAELRRTNATANGPAPGNAADDDLLRQLQEKARTPDLRRVGG